MGDPLIPEFGLAPREDDEGLFSRDIDGQLVRLDAATEADYHKLVTVQVNGRAVEVPLAQPLKDAQGNIVQDIKGRTTPRYTTIFDAVAKLNAVRKPSEEIFIPTLCHQPHMTPVAVCRLCMVQVYGQRNGRRSPERKLLPACQHQVKDGMEVFTIEAAGSDGDRVRRAVGIVTELLMADHLKPAPPPAPAAELAPYNELQQMADRLGLSRSRFGLDLLVAGAVPPPMVEPPAGHRTLDASSPVFLIDHSACILCDRCSRACNEVKNNQVIGRTGKGRFAGIGFDLNDEMFGSTCVQCGECMVSCPTSAITFRPIDEVKSRTSGTAEVVPLEELKKDPQNLFAGVPPKFLLWQKGLVLERKFKTGDFLCRQGEPGHSAFIIKSGRLEVRGWPPGERAGGRGKPPVRPVLREERTVKDVILGEMACLSGTPRTADLRALEDGEVWEVRRNVLDRMMRSPDQRSKFEAIYRDRALETARRTSQLFSGLPEDEYREITKFLEPEPHLAFVRVNPDQTIFRQGDLADCMFLVRLGHVRVGINRYGEEATVLYRGPGTVIGEIGLLAISPEDANKSVEQVDRALGVALAGAGAGGLSAALPAGRRTATCSALDHVEMARIDRDVFLEMVQKFPKLRRNLVEMALGRLKGDSDPSPARRQHVEQGLYQGQSLLVLDLTKCTRCDECTKACVQQHGTESHGYPITRLLREGLRFGDFLVATSCRSCKDAYCMIGCPVDSIHRGKHLQIVIEDHCIGCGLCANNCPYGNIFMLGNERDLVEAEDPEHPGQTRRVARPKAATCDLCDAEGYEEHSEPRCVYACPHDAAHRKTGDELLAEVLRAQGKS
jgi:Fe-S-cluster-containing dehydrogenase component